MNNLTWEQFVINVQGWAKERGIYARSTPTAQLLKTISELGEVADAVIKSDREALADGIGDVAVCLVNYWTMMGRFIKSPFEASDVVKKLQFQHLESFDSPAKARADLFGTLLLEIADLLHGEEQPFSANVDTICLIAATSGLDFMACCTSAWEEIKDRKGRMVAGGAFVKESEDE